MTLVILKENEITATLLALAILLASANVFGTLMEKIKAPRVVGEIIGGLFLGGTCLYSVIPNAMSNLFYAYNEEGKVLNVFYQLGLIFLMYLSGFNTTLEINKENSKIIKNVFIGATIIPIVLAIPFSYIFINNFKGNDTNDISFILVFVIGVAITSIPVISKIFFDMGVMNTKFSDIILTVSAFQDLCLWVLLNIATKMNKSGSINTAEMIDVIVATISLFVIAKAISNYTSKKHSIEKYTYSNGFYSVSFIALLVSCAIMSISGINIMYSAFLVGYIVKSLHGDNTEIKQAMKYLEKFSFSFFVPIYFALVGIQLNLLHNFSLIRFVIFFVIAFSLEALGTIIMLHFVKLRKKVKINFAITMNARGGPGIVLATVAYSYDIINVEFFTVLILTTMLSSLIAGYWLRMQQKIDSTVFTELS